MSEASRSRSTDQRYYGVVEGIVTQVRDDGVAKVKFPCFHDEMESEWCRIAQFFAGPNHGAFFIPEVNSEVLVAFIHGDMRLPIIVGGLYNGVDRPPGTDTDFDTHVRVRRIESFNGYKICFFDDGEQDNAGGVMVEVDEDTRITLSSNGTVRIQGTVISLESPIIKLNGRVVTPNSNSI